MVRRVLSEDPTERIEGLAKVVRICELAIAICGLAVVILGFLYLVGRQNLETDCTVPHHACYDRGQKTTEKVLEEIKLTTEASNYCSTLPNINSFSKLHNCVETVLVKILKEGK